MRRGSKVFLVLALAFGLVAFGGVAAASNGTVKLKAQMSGAQEVPAADPDGRGLAEVVIDVDGEEACFDIKVANTGAPNRGHIHKEAVGVNGPIVVTFFELRPGDAPATDPRHDEIERGRIQGCVTADSALLADIVAHPEAYYVNVHNTRYPGGNLRCQLDG
jgi:hypothetical protein